MTAATRRKIAQLRALAASTTFPEEAKSARAKADKLEQSLGGPDKGKYGGFAGPQDIPPPFRANNFRHVDLNGQLSPEMMEALMQAMQTQMERSFMGSFHGFDIFTTPTKEGKTNG